MILGYWIFRLPNGQTLDLRNPNQVVIPDDINLSTLPRFYVEAEVGATPTLEEYEAARLARNRDKIWKFDDRDIDMIEKSVDKVLAKGAGQ